MNPELLLHPNIPKPLHGINPRTIYGQKWWDFNRQEAYAKANYHCEACGIPKVEAWKHRWLEAHEFYEYDYKHGRVTFVKLVALCHACHNFIHSGRLNVLVQSRKISEEDYSHIIHHGGDIVDAAGLTEKYKHRHDAPEGLVAWDQWRMIVDGKEYGPSTSCMANWSRGEWKLWKPGRVIDRPRQGRYLYGNLDDDADD